MKIIVDKMPNESEECIFSRPINLTPYPMHYVCRFGNICNIDNCNVLKSIDDFNFGKNDGIGNKKDKSGE